MMIDDAVLLEKFASVGATTTYGWRHTGTLATNKWSNGNIAVIHHGDVWLVTASMGARDGAGTQHFSTWDESLETIAREWAPTHLGFRLILRGLTTIGWKK